MPKSDTIVVSCDELLEYDEDAAQCGADASTVPRTPSSTPPKTPGLPVPDASAPPAPPTSKS